MRYHSHFTKLTQYYNRKSQSINKCWCFFLLQIPELPPIRGNKCSWNCKFMNLTVYTLYFAHHI